MTLLKTNLRDLFWLVPLVMLVILGAYVSSYYCTCEYAASFSRPDPYWGIVRFYSSRGECMTFAPLAWCESHVRRCQVVLTCDEAWDGSFRVVLTGDWHGRPGHIPSL
jgi:hypothetical protein